MFEFATRFYLMLASRNYVFKESALKTAADWSVSNGRRFRTNIIIWGMRKHYSTLEVATHDSSRCKF